MSIQGSKILITGGSSGIGKATAKLLVSQGAQVLITGRDEARLKAAAAETGALYAVADIGSEAGAELTAQVAIQQLGHVDVLINNAGIGEFDRLENLSWEAFERVFATNVFGVAILTGKLVPGMRERGEGTIINIASTASLKGFASGSIYSASKFALRSMSQCWHEELRRFGIRVCQVNPSEVTTAFNQADRQSRPDQPKKLRSEDIAQTIASILALDAHAMVPEVTVYATNPF